MRFCCVKFRVHNPIFVTNRNTKLLIHVAMFYSIVYSAENHASMSGFK